MTQSHLRGVRDVMVKACPFSTANVRAEGRLLGPKGNVIRQIRPGTEDTFPLGLWLEAAGVSLGAVSDAPDAAHNEAESTMRREGVVLVANFVYRNQPETLSFMPNLLVSEDDSIRYDLEVQRVAETGYHMHQATVHENAAGGSSVRELRTSYGVLIRFVQTGKLGRFSRSALADQIVLKLGMLGLVQLILDLYWQYVLPYFGLDYNAQVFRWTVRKHFGSFGMAKAV
eukprot:gnl/MRDRNA2_/MRDRNA2_191087_c0_seq1.p1 gnl/MRDRNA2_/MRDRNA2_191087_c0~~gnl/MRDRNA2_/MRDRNA2_191087_c0_seq1.p1  ORF type:complete len:228 (+),score=36.24 gnl/MRDRNA2_/MRDRNA2_191087_c0_seq1:261-944(+)